jgi:hypothetical protein
VFAGIVEIQGRSQAPRSHFAQTRVRAHSVKRRAVSDPRSLDPVQYLVEFCGRYSEGIVFEAFRAKWRDLNLKVSIDSQNSKRPVLPFVRESQDFGVEIEAFFKVVDLSLMWDC